MEYLKLIGILIVILGFALKLDSILIIGVIAQFNEVIPHLPFCGHLKQFLSRLTGVSFGPPGLPGFHSATPSFFGRFFAASELGVFTQLNDVI